MISAVIAGRFAVAFHAGGEVQAGFVEEFLDEAGGALMDEDEPGGDDDCEDGKADERLQMASTIWRIRRQFQLLALQTSRIRRRSRVNAVHAEGLGAFGEAGQPEGNPKDGGGPDGGFFVATGCPVEESEAGLAGGRRRTSSRRR